MENLTSRKQKSLQGTKKNRMKNNTLLAKIHSLAPLPKQKQVFIHTM